jgi:predicted nucleic acid-binding protein
MSLVDTSVWIEFFRNADSDAANALEALLNQNEFLCINAIIEMEILQGIRSQRDHQSVKDYLSDFQYFPSMPHRYFELASDIFRTCRKRGLTIRRSLDCLIAANALHEGLPIIHHDRDFELIRKAWPQLKTIAV